MILLNWLSPQLLLGYEADACMQEGQYENILKVVFTEDHGKVVHAASGWLLGGVRVYSVSTKSERGGHRPS